MWSTVCELIQLSPSERRKLNTGKTPSPYALTPAAGENIVLFEDDHLLIDADHTGIYGIECVVRYGEYASAGVSEKYNFGWYIEFLGKDANRGWRPELGYWVKTANNGELRIKIKED